MAYLGNHDAISLGLAVKLFILAIAAAFSDFWHPAFYASDVSSGLVFVMVTVFAAMLVAVLNLASLCLAVIATEAARPVSAFMSGACAVLCGLALATFSGSLLSLASPWLLVMLIGPLAALTVHLVLIQQHMLRDCPLYKLVLACTLTLVALLSMSTHYWWSAMAAGSWGNPTVGLFRLPRSGPAVLLQMCSLLNFLCLMAASGVFGLGLCTSRAWLAGNPLGEALSQYLGIGLVAGSLVLSCVASIAYGLAARYTNSMLTAAALSDAVMCLLYQLLSMDTELQDI